MAAKQHIARIMLPTVTLIFRDFLFPQVPCKIHEKFPSRSGIIIFEHSTVIIPNARDMEIYKSWKQGTRVNTGYAGIGDAHVASFENINGNLIIILNGTTNVFDLNMSAELYTANQEKIGKESVELIHKAIKKHFGQRIKDFSRSSVKWTCEKSGLFTLKNGVTPIPKKFIPRGWNPHGE